MYRIKIIVVMILLLAVPAAAITNCIELELDVISTLYYITVPTYISAIVASFTYLIWSE